MSKKKLENHYTLDRDDLEKSQLGGVSAQIGLKLGYEIPWDCYFLGFEGTLTHQKAKSTHHTRSIGLVNHHIRTVLGDMVGFAVHPGIKINQLNKVYLKFGYQRVRYKATNENRLIRDGLRSKSGVRERFLSGISLDIACSPESKWAWGIEANYIVFPSFTMDRVVDGRSTSSIHQGQVALHLKRTL